MNLLKNKNSIYKKYNALLKYVRKEMKPERFKHAVNTVEYGFILCEHFSFKRFVFEKFFIAALFHDLAKDFSRKRTNMLLCSVSMDRESRAIEPIWHAFISAFLLKSRFDIHDITILNAIKFHPTGHQAFGTVGKLLFVSDYCEKGRSFRGVKKARRISRTDLNSACLEIVEKKIEYILKMRLPLHSYSVHFRNFLLKIL